MDLTCVLVSISAVCATCVIYLTALPPYIDLYFVYNNAHPCLGQASKAKSPRQPHVVINIPLLPTIGTETRQPGKHMMNTRDGVVTIFTDMGTLTGLSKLFRDEGMVLPAWVHYLAFDLLAGHYCVQKNMA